MKTRKKSYSKLIAFVATFLIIPFGFVFQSCEDAVEILNLLDNARLFEVKYQFIDDAIMPTSTAMILAEDKDAAFLSQAETFMPKSPAVNAGASNRVTMNGDPTTRGSNFRIKMQNETLFVKTIEIQSTSGPFFTGQVLTGAIINVTTISNKMLNTDQPDTYSTITITELDTVNRRIYGEFHFVARYKEDPLGEDYLSGADGSFTFPY